MIIEGSPYCTYLDIFVGTERKSGPSLQHSKGQVNFKRDGLIFTFCPSVKLVDFIHNFP